LLVQITLNKARQQGRRNSAGLRDVRRETNESGLLPAIPDDQPSPEEALILNDVIEQALEKLPEGQRPAYEKLIELKLADYSNDEIADQLGIVRRTVERKGSSRSESVRPRTSSKCQRGHAFQRFCRIFKIPCRRMIGVRNWSETPL
jgi:DNA-directed RNA polymerase specialized sigma24 family protein